MPSAGWRTAVRRLREQAPVKAPGSHVIIRESFLFKKTQDSMPKLKTLRVGVKRFKKTGTGLVFAVNAFCAPHPDLQAAQAQEELHTNVVADAADQKV